MPLGSVILKGTLYSPFRMKFWLVRGVEKDEFEGVFEGDFEEDFEGDFEGEMEVCLKQMSQEQQQVLPAT